MKKNLNEKGFTLVELISVVVILGLIGLIAVPAVSKTIRDAKKEKSNVNADTILNAAYDYAQRNISVLPDSKDGSVTSFCATELICAGFLKSDIIKEQDDFTSHMVTITYYAGTSSVPDKLPESSKFFGNYLFRYEPSTSACKVSCETE